MGEYKTHKMAANTVVAMVKREGKNTDLLTLINNMPDQYFAPCTVTCKAATQKNIPITLSSL